MSDLKKIMRMKEDIRELMNEQMKLEGKKQNLMEKLKEYDCDTLDEAEKKYKKMQQDCAKKEESLDLLVDDFMKEYSDVV